MDSRISFPPNRIEARVESYPSNHINCSSPLKGMQPPVQQKIPICGACFSYLHHNCCQNSTRIGVNKKQMASGLHSTTEDTFSINQRIPLELHVLCTQPIKDHKPSKITVLRNSLFKPDQVLPRNLICSCSNLLPGEAGHKSSSVQPKGSIGTTSRNNTTLCKSM